MKTDHLHTIRSNEPGEKQGLLPETRRWVGQLPSCLELRSLTQQFPRIANQLASLWGQPAQCERYIDSLLFNDRLDIRRGFPPPVCMEIMHLKYALLEVFDEGRKSAQLQLHKA